MAARSSSAPPRSRCSSRAATTCASTGRSTSTGVRSSSGSRSIFRATSHVRPCRSRPASGPRSTAVCAHFKHALYEAFFCEGEDIATDREIARAATIAGLDPDGAVAAAYSAERFERIGLIRRDAEAMGIRGVPSLLTDGGESHWGMGGLARLIAGETLVPRAV